MTSQRRREVRETKRNETCLPFKVLFSTVALPKFPKNFKWLLRYVCAKRWLSALRAVWSTPLEELLNSLKSFQVCVELWSTEAMLAGSEASWLCAVVYCKSDNGDQTCSGDKPSAVLIWEPLVYCVCLCVCVCLSVCVCVCVKEPTSGDAGPA